MINHQKLTQDIMSRVRTIYYFQLWGRPATELLVLVGFLLAAKQLVFWQAAMFNMAQRSIYLWPNYGLGAFWHTGLAIKLVLIGLVFTGSWLVADTMKASHFLRRAA